ncbi:MAG: PilZ domain-containing protein [Xanthobacteraceae bacterium]
MSDRELGQVATRGGRSRAWEGELARDSGRDLRRSKRTPKRNAARIIYSSGAQIPCVLWDISAGGARLSAAHSNFLPHVFHLDQGGGAASRRPCRVVWRNEGHLGVQFIEDGEVEELEGAQFRRQRKLTVAPAHAVGRQLAITTEMLLLPGCGPRAALNAGRRGVTFSSIAAVMVAMLAGTTILLYWAGAQTGVDVSWAQQVCTTARNFCQHPEWTAAAGAVMTVVYLAVKGMEL